MDGGSPDSDRGSEASPDGFPTSRVVANMLKANNAECTVGCIMPASMSMANRPRYANDGTNL